MEFALPDWSALPLPGIVLLFAAAAGVVLLAGTRLTRLADRLADVSGMGEAITGALFLGALTSLSGSVTSIAAAARGAPELALANGFGGIAAQTVFLVAADLVWRRANLEHAAASLQNVITGVLLIVLLALVLIAITLPPVEIFNLHPVTPILFLVYLGGMRMQAVARSEPMWGPARTEETREDRPQEPRGGAGANAVLIVAILALGALVGVAGYVIAQTGLEISARTGLSEGFVGAILTSIATSTPELVTTVAAVRRGALTLAVSGILGGNAFDVLFAGFSDVAYTSGSIFHAIEPGQVFLVILSIVMTATLLLGLLVRQRFGPANIGWESVALLGLYAGGVAAIAFVF